MNEKSTAGKVLAKFESTKPKVECHKGDEIHFDIGEDKTPVKGEMITDKSKDGGFLVKANKDIRDEPISEDEMERLNAAYDVDYSKDDYNRIVERSDKTIIGFTSKSESAADENRLNALKPNVKKVVGLFQDKGFVLTGFDQTRGENWINFGHKIKNKPVTISVLIDPKDPEKVVIIGNGDRYIATDIKSVNAIMKDLVAGPSYGKYQEP